MSTISQAKIAALIPEDRALMTQKENLAVIYQLIDILPQFLHFLLQIVG